MSGRGAFPLALLFGLAAAAAAQELRLTLPRGAAPGEELEVRCYGRGLGDTESVLWFRDGIEVLELNTERDDRVQLKLRVRDDCELGAHLFLLHTRRGITRPKTFHVGPLPAVASVDGNDSAERAQRIDLDVCVDGRILAEETDWFAFDAAAGQPVRIEAEGIRLADADLDLQFEVFGPDGGLVVRADDSSIGRLDPAAGIRCEVAGTYRIALRDVAFGGSAASAYRLHVGTFPRPLGLVPAGGRPGETIEVALLGDLEPARATLTLPERPGLHEVFPSVDGRSVPTAMRIAVDDRPSFVEGAEADEPPAAPCAFHGVVAAEHEEDRFRFRAKKGERIEIRVLARNLRSPLDPVLYVREEGGKYLAGDDDGLGLDGRLRFTAPADGVFLACVRDHLQRGGDAFFYRVEVGELPAGATTRETVPGRRPEDLGVAVPRGGRNATLVEVSGLDARDGIDVGWSGLPTGVTAALIRLSTGVPTVPVVFVAAADAPLHAALADPTARADQEPHQRVLSHQHGFPLLRIANNDVYEQRAVRQLPVAVTESCPFDVAATSPPVPLVQDGSMGLPVAITRADGFDETVVIRMLWTPPGISAGTVTLRRGQTSGSLYLGARSTAAVGRWPIVLVATAGVGGVSRSASTDVLTLDVQEPWITAKLSRAKLEQGASTVLAVELQRRREFAGSVSAELGRMPKGVTAEFPPITADLEHVDIALAAAADAQVGRHRSVYLRLWIDTPDGQIVHTVGGGEIRVDRPLPSALRRGAEADGGNER